MSASTEHAIVYGGSMVGLVTAGRLARCFKHVTLVERDRFEDAPGARRGVPQAVHIHGLYTRGLRSYREVFPELERVLEELGGPAFDMSATMAWCVGGTWAPRPECGLKLYAVSRMLFEFVVREQLKKLPNVRILDGREVTGWLTTPDRARVTGVRLQAAGDGPEETLEGALVVDCTGRGSRTPQWLEALGYPRVEESHNKINVVYVSRLYRKPEGFAPGWRYINLTPRMPEQRRLGLVQEIEGDRWLVLLGGWLGAGPQPDEASFLEFARQLPQPHIYEALRNAEPLGPPQRAVFSQSQWRHYERLERVPERFVVAGDGFCSLNPVYGQGMTTGAMQSEVLFDCVREGLDGASLRYNRRVGKLLADPWSVGTISDLRFAEAEGSRPPGLPLLQWFTDRVLRAASYDEEVLVRFLRVQHMEESPLALASPRTLFKVLTARPPAVPAPGPEPIAAARPESRSRTA
jgi:2-polyprenyl-6-methoxyphenol hydroxylase-like FAD-dependent oxidoreductase